MKNKNTISYGTSILIVFGTLLAPHISFANTYSPPVIMSSGVLLQGYNNNMNSTNTNGTDTTNTRNKTTGANGNTTNSTTNINTSFGSNDTANGIHFGNQSSNAVCVNDEVTDSIMYTNNTGHDIADSMLRIDLSPDTTFVKSSAGTYTDSTHSILIHTANLRKGDALQVFVTVTPTTNAQNARQFSHRVEFNYTLDNGTQNTLVGYSFHNVDTCGNNLGAFALGSGFFPSTAFGWFLVIALIIIVIFISRRFRKKEAHGAHH